jgi:hypothetical protein
MTIIKSTSCLRHFPHRVLPSALVERFLRIEPESQVKLTTLKLFECYCDLTDVDINKPKTLRKAVLRFVGALSDQSFVISNKDTRNKYARHIISIYNVLSLEANDGEQINWDPNLPELYAYYWIGYPIAPYKLVYWQDWVVVSRKKDNNYLPFPKVYLTHGEEFTLQLHKSIKHFFASQAKPAQTPFVMMMEFLTANQSAWPAYIFNSSREIWNFFVAFRRFFFLRAIDLKLALEAQKKLWNTFIVNIYACLIDSKAWATPYKPLPQAPTSELDPTTSRIKTRSDGNQVRTKLITDIPLHITDEQAIQFLFRDIKQDLKIVINWALAETNKLISARKNRDLLAQGGSPIHKIAGWKHLEDIGLSNICATFTQDGYKFDRAYLESKFGTGVYRECLAKLFALPNSGDLFPFQCLLVARHPTITPSFLDKFELYSKQGHLSGFIQTIGGYQLIGFKDRKHDNKSEQKVDLTPETATLIQELIEITKPMRNYLRRKNEDKWRYLFLCSGGTYAEPSCPGILSWNTSRLSYQSTGTLLSAQFAPHTSLTDPELSEFLKRVSLSTIRASSVVTNYIEHQSPELASKELGHTKYIPKLISRYIPTELYNFLQSRYIRIFQNAMICVALEGSPHLLKATKFRNIDELHDFLKLYALKDIPEDLSGREKPAENTETLGHAYISISPAILSVLFSLQTAVEAGLESSKIDISAKALYWTSFAKNLKREIEAGTDPLLKSHLLEALNNLAPDKMSQIIYEPS